MEFFLKTVKSLTFLPAHFKNYFFQFCEHKTRYLYQWYLPADTAQYLYQDHRGVATVQYLVPGDTSLSQIT